jgi:hypothetical protein
MQMGPDQHLSSYAEMSSVSISNRDSKHSSILKYMT